MRKEEFRKWLTSVDGRNGAQTSDHISRIKRIESAISVLDQKDCDVEDECNKDGGVTLLDRLPLVLEYPADGACLKVLICP